MEKYLKLIIILVTIWHEYIVLSVPNKIIVSHNALRSN